MALLFGDLDGDGLPEIAACEFRARPESSLSCGTKVYPVHLLLPPHQIDSLHRHFQCTHRRFGRRDSKPDLAATALLGASVLIYGNQSTSSTIQFAAPVVIPANTNPGGWILRDLDGRRKDRYRRRLDCAKNMVILNNKSTSGNFIFQTLTIHNIH